jgi:Rieske Fe-S protein
MTETTRRAVVFGAGGAGLAFALSACGGSDTGGSDAAAPAGDQAQQGGMIAQTSDIPTGGGKVFGDQKIVITQPSSGQFKAFSAICTHEGCTVGSVSNGTINCPCHGSKYDINDGSVKNGPATQPLPEQKISVSGANITLG